MRNAKRETLKKILHYLRPYLPLLILSLLFSAATVILQLMSPILAGRTIDYIVGPSDVDFPELAKVLIFFLTATGAAFATQWK